jgi:[ribosomal protein S5]-alanine N-acetyltransferase
MIALTERLILRELHPDDLDTVWVLFSHPDILKTTIHTLTRERCAQWIAKQQERYKTRGFAPWAVELRSSNMVIGYCGMDVEQIDGAREVEIGYRVLPSFWGQGLATEAAIGALLHGFTTLNLQRIVATVLERNGASLRVVEKSGMQYEKDTVLYGKTLRLYAAHASSWHEPAHDGRERIPSPDERSCTTRSVTRDP